jgi:protein SCO1
MKTHLSPSLSHSAGLPGVCHILYDKCRYVVLALTVPLAFAGERPVDAAKDTGCACCQEKVVVKKDACCAEIPAAKAPAGAPFSKESIYQLDGRFTDDAGRSFALGDLRGRPVVLDMFFASCGYACPLTVTDMLAIQGRLPAALRAKTVFVLVSFDVTRDTPEALAKYRAERGLDARWILLRGDDDSVRELAALLGVKYKREADGAFSHSNLLTVLNPAGEIVHQRTGLQGGLDEAAAALAATVQ